VEKHKRPFDVRIGPEAGLRKIAYDVSITDPRGTTNLGRGSATKRGVAVKAVEQSKLNNISKLSLQSVTQDQFAPFALELSGGLGKHALDALRSWAVVAVPGDDKDRGTRLRRAMWISKTRKSLAMTVARAYSFVVSTKHRLITKAFVRKANVPFSGISPEMDPGADLSTFGPVTSRGEEVEMHPAGRGYSPTFAADPHPDVDLSAPFMGGVPIPPPRSGDAAGPLFSGIAPSSDQEIESRRLGSGERT
jgi:hypothetical protein